MDLWNKLFSSKYKNESQKDKLDRQAQFYLDINYPHGSYSISPWPLQATVRVVIFRECDRRGRKLLYDSRTVVRVPLKDNQEGNTSAYTFGSSVTCGREIMHKTSHSFHSTIPVESIPDGTKFASSLGSISDKHFSSKKHNSSKAGNAFLEIRNGFGYQYEKECSDIKAIGEHIFGAVALAYKGPSLKIHLIKDPESILISRTCKAPRSYRSAHASCDTGLEDSFSSFSNSLSDPHITRMESLEDSLNRTSIKPFFSAETYPGIGPCQSEDDSGYSGPSSPYSSLFGLYLKAGPYTPNSSGTPTSCQGSGNSLRNLSGSLSSLRRRFLRNVATSLGSFGIINVEQQPNEDFSQYNSKLGLALLIETRQDDYDAKRNLRDWVFGHFVIIESLMNKLQGDLEMAYLHNTSFISTMYESISEVQQEINDMIYAPRLHEPLWLSLLGADSTKKEKLYLKLTEALFYILNNYDTKNTNFFVSKLFTAVLTHHLGWVSTVATQTTFLNKSSSNDKTSQHSHINLSKFLYDNLPYNALWGQLCELMGAFGNPCRMTKTIVVGRDKNILSPILVILSYLIRCSQVEENIFEKMDDSIQTSNVSNSNKSDTVADSSNQSVRVKQKNNSVRRKWSKRCNCKKNKEPSERFSSHKNFIEKALNKSDKNINNERIVGGESNLIESKLLDKKEHKRNLSSCEDATSMAKQIGINKQSLKSSKTIHNFADLIDDNVLSSAQLDNMQSTKSDEILQNMDKYCCNPSHMKDNSAKLSKSVTVSGEEINVEIEQGEKVLFILGENERLEGLKTNVPNILSNNKLPTNLSYKSRFISALSHERKELVHRRTKSYTTVELVSLQKETCLIYPQLKEELADISLLSSPYSLRYFKTHHRNFSDPTNGAFFNLLPPNIKNVNKYDNNTDINSKITCENISKNVIPEKVTNVHEVLNMPSVEVSSTVYSRIAESLLGGILDHYSCSFVLQAIAEDNNLEEKLRLDLITTAHNSSLNSQPKEAVAIVAEIEKWEVELVSSHSQPFEKKASKGSILSHVNYGGIPVMMSPLVSQITDSLLHLLRLRTPPHFIVHCFEHHLRDLYLKSQLLSEYLLECVPMTFGQPESSNVGTKRPSNLSELTQTLGIDVNDLPLLLSIASTHTPALTQMFGLTFT